jgi:hypothetical protein
MMQAEMAGNPAKVHPIYIHLDRFPSYFFWIDPGFGFWCVFDLAEHAAIALTAAARFPGSVLSFCSMTSWTFNHAFILAQFLATPKIPNFLVIRNIYSISYS